MIKLFSPNITSKETLAVTKTLKSLNWASGAGQGKVLEFENELKKYLKADECVAVDNGTAALHLALNLININKKEVLVPSLTFVSTVHAVLYNGGIPVFVDVDPKTLSIDIKDIEKKINSKTKAIVPVHFGGFPVELKKIFNISKKNNLEVVEDAAHAFGSTSSGNKIGSKGNFTCFSFHPVKNLAVPKGGAIVLNGKNSKKNKKILKSMRWCGIDNRIGTQYDITNLGFNYYMDEISATIGINQLKRIDRLNNKRKKIAKKYSKNLEFEEKMPYSDECSYHLYWILVKNRNEFIKKMKEKNIETGTHYSPVHLMKYYKSKTILPITEKIGKEIVTLPMHTNLNDEEVNFIINTANNIKKNI